MASVKTLSTLFPAQWGISADDICFFAAITLNDMADIAKALVTAYGCISLADKAITATLSKRNSNRLTLIYFVTVFSSGRSDISDEKRERLMKARRIAFNLMNKPYQRAVRKVMNNEVFNSEMELMVRQIYYTVVIHIRTGHLRKTLTKRVGEADFSVESFLSILQRRSQPCMLLFFMYFARALWLHEEKNEQGNEIIKRNCDALMKRIWAVLPQEYVNAHNSAVLRTSPSRNGHHRNTRGAELQQAAMEQTKPRQKQRRRRSPLTVLTDSAAMRAASSSAQGCKRKSAFTPLPPKKRFARSENI